MIGISIISIGLSYAQPTIPKTAISSDIPVDVREQIERLYSPDPVERAYGAYYLGEMSEKAAPAIPYLIGIFHDGEEIKKGSLIIPIPGKGTTPGTQAAKALAKIGEPAIEPLVRSLKDRNSKVRGWAAWALGEIRDNRAVESLITTLRDKEIDVRIMVAGALGKIRDTRAIESLITALEESHMIVAGMVAGALVEIGHPSVEPLIAALNNENVEVRRWAARILKEITGQDFGENPTKWQKWWEKNKGK